MVALQRSAGNAATLALLRRANKAGEESPISLTLPGVVDHAAVSSWSMGPSDGKGGPTSVSIIRPTDGNSQRLMQAASTSWPDDATGTLVVRRRTSGGWVHALTVAMEHCTVVSYSAYDGRHESVSFHFTRARIDQPGG